MDRFEQELRNALRRKDPGSDFAACVLARIDAEPAPTRWKRWIEMPRLRWAAALALVLVAIAAASWYQGRQRRLKGEAAREQVFVALRIASAKLQVAEAKVQQLSERP